MMVQIVVTIPDLAMGIFLSSVFRSVIKEGGNHTLERDLYHKFH